MIPNVSNVNSFTNKNKQNMQQFQKDLTNNFMSAQNRNNFMQMSMNTSIIPQKNNTHNKNFINTSQNFQDFRES